MWNTKTNRTTVPWEYKGLNLKYIIGDIHGCYNTLMELVDTLPKDAELIFVGDLIDRGKDSLKIIDFIKDNQFTELKEMEILRERIGVMNEITQYVGEYYSKEWVMRNVLRMSDDDIEDMKKQIEQEVKSGEIDDGEEEQQEPVAPKPVPVQVVPDKKTEE